jgi:hypothetical protein
MILPFLSVNKADCQHNGLPNSGKVISGIIPIHIAFRQIEGDQFASKAATNTESIENRREEELKLRLLVNTV